MNYIDTYKDISISSEVLGTSPAKQIMLLLEKLDKDIIASIEAINNKNISMKCKRITSANNIVLYFVECLDFNADAKLAGTLEGIYNHLEKLLFWANSNNDVEKLQEARIISQNLNSWWKNAIS